MEIDKIAGICEDTAKEMDYRNKLEKKISSIEKLLGKSKIFLNLLITQRIFHLFSAALKSKYSESTKKLENAVPAIESSQKNLLLVNNKHNRLRKICDQVGKTIQGDSYR